MRIGWEEYDPKSGVITQVLGRSYRDHEETRSHVGRELSENMEKMKGTAWATDLKRQHQSDVRSSTVRRD